MLNRSGHKMIKAMKWPLLVLVLLGGEARAQAPVIPYFGVTSPTGAKGFQPVDASHPLPVTGGGGSGAAIGPTAVGSPSANPPVQIGGTANGTATGLIQTNTVKAASTAAVATDTSEVVQLNPLSPGIIAAAIPGTPNTTQVLSIQGETGMTPVTVQTSDPCTSALKQSVPISVATATTTSLVGVSGSTTVYVCGFSITIAPAAVTAATALFEYGTGATCTSPTSLTGTFGNGDLTTAAPPSQISYGNGGSTVFRSTASNGVCILTAGGSVSVQGVLTYVQQ